MMQKAYLKFSTVSSIRRPGMPHERSRWQDLIQHEQKLHGEILGKLQNGERVEGIEKNPLLSESQDVVYDYSNVPGFLQKE
jgi:hypothetical protein